MNEISRRKSPRVKLDVFVGETVGGKYFLPLAADLSEDGIYLECPNGIERLGNAPVVEFTLPGLSDLIWARCRTLRTEGKGFFTGRALRFVNIAPVDRQKIRYFIHRRCGMR